MRGAVMMILKVESLQSEGDKRPGFWARGVYKGGFSAFGVLELGTAWPSMSRVEDRGILAAMLRRFGAV